MIIIFVLVAFWIYLWVLYKGIVYALPMIGGWYAAHFAADTGAGFWGAGAVFLIVAFAIYVIGQVLYARITSPLTGLALSGAYCLPAGLIAFFAVQDISDMSGNRGPNTIWEIVFASIAALISASVAFMRLRALAPTADRDPRESFR